jgi:hypothetical protein
MVTVIADIVVYDEDGCEVSRTACEITETGAITFPPLVTIRNGWSFTVSRRT